LQKLREQGALSVEEFATEKQKILDAATIPNLSSAGAMSLEPSRGSVAEIQELLDKRGLNAPGAAQVLGELLPDDVDGIAVLGPDGEQGVIAVHGARAALWWRDGRDAESLDLRCVARVKRMERLITLDVPGRGEITIHAGSDRFAKGWMTRLAKLGVA
jgi:hypothetical protein